MQSALAEGACIRPQTHKPKPAFDTKIAGADGQHVADRQIIARPIKIPASIPPFALRRADLRIAIARDGFRRGRVIDKLGRVVRALHRQEQADIVVIGIAADCGEEHGLFLK